MTFPTPWQVGLKAYVEGGRDAYGNPVDSWAEPVLVDVYGWAPPSADGEPFEAGRVLVVRDLDVYVPASFTCGPKDRLVIDGLEYDVVGHPRDFNHGPFGWQPGSVVYVKRVEEHG